MPILLKYIWKVLSHPFYIRHNSRKSVTCPRLYVSKMGSGHVHRSVWSEIPLCLCLWRFSMYYSTSGLHFRKRGSFRNVLLYHYINTTHRSHSNSTSVSPNNKKEMTAKESCLLIQLHLWTASKKSKPGSKLWRQRYESHVNHTFAVQPRIINFIYFSLNFFINIIITL